MDKKTISEQGWHKSRENYIKELFKVLKPEIIYLVKKIKQRPKFTKNNYSCYMAEILRLNEKCNLNIYLCANLLILGGGNKQGIKQALQVIKINEVNK